ncbi:eukaryotic translation initiation factor 4 gamma 3-like isoform X1 [Helicoverpa zea]|uniref:eukaryotic translation initiation factor 4 gamma 3-like isoform X1 n=1 Tax=Helicoverpa zea TaxID=7113 RepID=UPI001F5A8D81|nr:eukaryotic translation initiation factor 4 gamma 3-like isoform X1 [Helicoverpa zea]
MPMIVSPLFWEWFNIWLIQFLKDLYHEIKMVALRGTNSSLNTLSHGCVNHGSQSQQSAIDVAQSLQTSLNMPQSAVAQHINANQINLNSVSLQFIPQHTNANNIKHEQSSSRYSNSNCMQPSHHYRLLTQTRPVECYHPSGAAGAAYMPSAAGGAQASAQASLRVQPTPQPSAPPAPQQDMSKTTMAGHTYVSQNQTPQPRPQFANYQYRAQHGSRPNAHPRQQQSYIPSAAATATGPVMYPTLVFQPSPMGMQTYQQPRSTTPGYYPYMGHYIGYNTPPSHTPPYYYTSNNPQLPTPNLQANAPGGRSNPTTLVGPQGTPATPTAPTATLPHPQASTLMHHTMPGIRQAAPKRSHRVPIIHPDTRQEIFSDYNDIGLNNETNDRHISQPEPSAHSIAEEFNRMVNEAVNQPSCDNSFKANFVSKNVDAPAPPTPTSVQTQPNAISSINNNVVKSEILTVNESKHLGTDVAVESNETPIVSAISDSPVIVPKMPMNIKQLQKNSEQTVQSLVLDTNKSIPPNKQMKQSKNVPQIEELEKPPEDINSAQIAITTVAPITSSTAITSTVTPVPAATQATSTVTTQTPVPTATPAPQPQRIREPRERLKSEDKEKLKERESQEKETVSASSKPNGPTPAVIISVDSLAEASIFPTSQNQGLGVEQTKKQVTIKQYSPALEAETPADVASNVEPTSSEPLVETTPTATQLLSASIEKVAKEQLSKAPESKEQSSAIEAQVKLTQSISSVLRTNQSDLKMKDINLNKTTDPDTANGNNTEITKTETVKEDINKNEKVLTNIKNSNKKSTNKMANNEPNIKEAESYENGKNETDKVVNVENDKTQPADEMAAPKPAPEDTSKIEAQAAPAVFVPKYKYSEDQWSPLNTAGKKYYDIDLLKQIKDDPLSKNKPVNVSVLEHCNVIRTTPMQEPQPFTPISRPMNDSLFPPFAKPAGMGSRNNTSRDAKKDSRNAAPTGKGSVKLAPSPSVNSAHKPVIHVSLSLREEVKLNEVDSAWKPTRFRKDTVNEEEARTQELYKKFRGILNKLTPQKFDTLLERVKTLEINNQKRLEGVIDLVFEKAIDEPNFSEAYAAMCNKLSVLKVPADNPTSPDKCVNFRALIINKCQNQFETHKVDEQILKLESELAACTDPVKKKELTLMIDEENRRVRMRSVGNVRFIGELYKLKMLTSKIMDYCMKYLIDKVEEEKLECLCKLLTTIGEQVENEVNGQLDNIFKKMQDIVDRKSNKISSRVRFMLQDVIELRKRKWVAKTVIDSQPKMMDQIQKEAEQQQRHIELMNANPMGGFRRDEGGRGKRGDSRRQNPNTAFIDNTWKSSRANYPVDTLKLKAVTQKNLNNIKLAPHNSAWNHGSGTKNTAQASSNSMISISKNMYSVLENVQTDPTSLRANRDMTPNYSKGASIERSTFNSRGDFNASGSSSRSGSVGVARSNSGTRSTSAAPTTPPVANEAPAPAPAPVPQEPLPEAKKKSIKSLIDLCIINSDDVEMVADVKQLFTAQYHAAVVNEILNIAVEKPAKAIGLISKALLNLVTSNIISPENFISGMKEMLEFAPDLYIDIPMLYDNLGKIIAPQIEKKHITFVQLLKVSESIISAHHGHLFLKAVIRDLKESMGPSFVRSKWQESGIQIKQWMDEKLVTTWLEDNKFEFLEGDSKVSEETKKILTPVQTQSKLIQLMNADEGCECIKGWIKDKFGNTANEDWFMRALIQAICEHVLFGPEGRDVPHFNQDRMNKYASLIHDFGETKQSREASCLFGIQQLIHRLEHPQGLTLEIFQYLHDQYIISLDGFIAWEESEKEPEGKGVMMKALTSFFTNIKEADNEDSCSED